MSNNCECASEGFCPRYKLQMRPRMREICRGENIAPEHAETVRKQWLAQPAGTIVPVKLPFKPKTETCIHLGNSVRDAAGKAVTRPCPG